MVTIFNRRELLSTFSIKEQGEIRDILSQNNIDYHMKTVNRNSPSAMSAVLEVGRELVGKTRHMSVSIQYM